MKQQFLEDTVDTFKTYVYQNNRKAVPTSATLTVYKPGGDTKLLDGVTMTVASDGLLSYSLTAANNDIADDNYKAIVAYILSGTTYYANLFYDIVKSKLVSVITDDDLVNELPPLRDNGWRVHGTSTSGSTTTLIDIALQRYPDDYFTGGTAYSLEQQETREITDFVSSTGTVTTTAFPATAATDQYVLTQPYTNQIQRAFEKIEEMLKRNGKRAHLILDPYDLRELHIHLAVAEVCKGLANEGEGAIWWERWQYYDKRAFAIFNGLHFKYDISEDGYIAGKEEKKRTTRTLGRG